MVLQLSEKSALEDAAAVPAARFDVVAVGESSSCKGVLNAEERRESPERALKGVNGDEGDSVSRLLLEAVDVVLNMTRRALGLAVVDDEGVLGVGAVVNEVLLMGDEG